MAQRAHKQANPLSSKTPSRQQTASPATTSADSELLYRAFSRPDALRPADITHLQRTIGNQATQRLLAASLPQARSAARPTTGGSTDVRVQRTLAIDNDNYMGSYAGLYTQANMKPLLDGIGTVMDTYYPSEKVKRGPLPFIRAKGRYNVDTIAELIDYMTDTGAPEPDMNMTLQYGAEHGDYHFTGKVTKKKAQWTIAKGAAQTLMENAIRQHLPRLLAGSKNEGWSAWYIGENAGNVIGQSIEGPETKFTIQLQVGKEWNLISYHGYPDQRLLKFGVGTSKTDLS